MTHSHLRETRERHGLFYWYRRSPRPEDEPPLREWQLEIRKPCIREEREPPTTPWTPIPVLTFPNVSVATTGTKNVFAKERPAEELTNLCLRRYLFELVHILHDSRYAPTDLDYPSLASLETVTLRFAGSPTPYIRD